MNNIVLDFRHNYIRGERLEAQEIVYQYDAGRTVEAYVPETEANFFLHVGFENNPTLAVIEEVTTEQDAEEGGYKITASIPDSILTRYGTLLVYVVAVDGDKIVTTYEGQVPVRNKATAEDYIVPDEEATSIVERARAAANTATSAAETAEAAAAEAMSGTPEGYAQLVSDVTDLKADLTDYADYIVGVSIDFKPVFSPVIEQGGFLTDGLNDRLGSADHNKRVRSAEYFPLSTDKLYTVTISGSLNLLYSISFYTDNDFQTARQSNTNWLDSGTTFSCPANCRYGRILIKSDPSVNITPSEVTSLAISTSYTSIDERVTSLEDKVLIPDQNYVLGSDMIKRSVSKQYLGQLTYLQSFCVYNSKYYSINGSNISVQSSTFTEVNNVALNLGHGNSLQLGNGSLAYASGWDDNKVYIVDLETLTITDTITLPTTGYTTVAIDELNQIAYIFQRDSYPATEERYNFIVYDYANQEIKSTKQTVAFGAMQACDFYNDKIIVLNGLGTTACPNGYRVYDTNGNIVSEYFLGDFSAVEPEGVCIDRETHELYISFVDKKIYKVSI